MGKTRDSWRKAIRIVCIARHAKNCKVIENCNGNYCNNPLCHKSGEEHELVIDEIDNNKHNNDPDNEQLLCHSCNQKKSPKHLKPKRNTGSAGVREYLRDGATEMVDEGIRQRAIDNNPQMAVSEDMKQVYRSLLRQHVKRPQGLTVKEAIYGFAKKLDISPVTCRRYLGVEIESEDGIYTKKKKNVPMMDGTQKAFTFVIFRPEWEEVEKEPTPAELVELQKKYNPKQSVPTSTEKPPSEPIQPMVMKAQLERPRNLPDYIQ